MPKPNLALPITKPVSRWNKPLKVDSKELFKVLGKAIVNFKLGNAPGVATSALDAISTVSFEKDPGQLAWLLIQKALWQSSFDLILECALDLEPHSLEKSDEIAADLNLSLEQERLALDKNFLRRPRELPLLSKFQVPLKQWLLEYGLNEARAETVVERLPSYFVYALIDEWRKHPSDYAPITQAFETPFAKAGEREASWELYYAWLHKQIDEKVFDETFSLKQIYVPLRAYYEKPIKSDRFKGHEERLDKDEKVRHVVDLTQELDTWVEDANKSCEIRVISGGPGSGKSSFSKMYAAHRASKSDCRVLLVPLHQVDLKSDLKSALTEFVLAKWRRMDDLLEPQEGENHLLIIFDGLDELAMQGKAATETAQEFVREVEKLVNRRELSGMPLKIIISGRELAVQANASQFRDAKQILHILPYFIAEETRPKSNVPRKQHKYEDPQKLMETDQRQLWWQKYGSAMGQKYAEMPKELQSQELDEITAQPLLNYLVALSYERKRVDFSEAVNLNVIYADLLKAVYERAYEGHRHPSIGTLEEKDFNRILEEIGLAAWHGDGRTTTVREIQEHCQSASLTKLLGIFEKGAEAGVTGLLTAFYFRQHGDRRDGEQTFEFTHKSFGEYLIALRLVRALEWIQLQRQRHEDNPDDGWDEKQCLKHWAELCGPSPLDEYILRFLRNEISLQPQAAVKQWQTILCNLIGFMLRHGMPMELLSPRPNYHAEVRQSRNAEELLLVALNACSDVTKEISKIDWPDPTSVDSWLPFLSRDVKAGTLAFQCLSFLDLSDCIISVTNLSGANLRYSDLRDAELIMAILATADLKGANLEGADLIGADLSRANLEDANLAQADLTGANLAGSNLKEANLNGADLGGANLIGADTTGTTLRNADIVFSGVRTTFQEANLENVDFKGADLSWASLTYANLQDADIRYASLERADLQGADLRHADLRGADLRGANLRGAIGVDESES